MCSDGVRLASRYWTNFGDAGENYLSSWHESTLYVFIQQFRTIVSCIHFGMLFIAVHVQYYRDETREHVGYVMRHAKARFVFNRIQT